MNDWNRRSNLLHGPQLEQEERVKYREGIEITRACKMSKIRSRKGARAEEKLGDPFLIVESTHHQRKPRSSRYTMTPGSM